MNHPCLWAHQQLRDKKIDGMIWNLVEPRGIPNPEEEEYARRYGYLVAGMKERWTDIELGEFGTA